jgi:hypothetical protein
MNGRMTGLPTCFRHLSSRIAVAVAIAIMSWACGNVAPSVRHPAEEPGLVGLSDVAWPSEQELVYVGDRGESRTGLFVFDMVEGTSSPLDVPTESCTGMDHLQPQVDEPGKLLFIRLCGQPSEVTLYRGGLDGGAAERVADVSFLPSRYTRVPGTDSWLGGYDDGFCAWIAAFRVPAGIDWPIMVAHDGREVAVTAGSAAGIECGQAPMADLPAFASDGTLAFVAAPGADRVTGTSRFDVPWDLYLWTSGVARDPIVRGIVRPTDLAWSPDETRLAIAGAIDGRRGLWLIDRSGARELAFDGDISRLAWAPDGDSLAITVGDIPLKLVLVSIVPATTP